MVQDAQAPATKADIEMLLRQIASYYDETERRFIAIDDRFTAIDDRFAEMEERFEQRFVEFEDRIMRHFDLTVETIRHDLLGANRDEIETVKDRVTRLEKRVGIS